LKKVICTSFLAESTFLTPIDFSTYESQKRDHHHHIFSRFMSNAGPLKIDSSPAGKIVYGRGGNEWSTVIEAGLVSTQSASALAGRASATLLPKGTGLFTVMNGLTFLHHQTHDRDFAFHYQGNCDMSPFDASGSRQTTHYPRRFRPPINRQIDAIVIQAFPDEKRAQLEKRVWDIQRHFPQAIVGVDLKQNEYIFPPDSPGEFALRT
jgi:hypothetical protein